MEDVKLSLALIWSTGQTRETFEYTVVMMNKQSYTRKHKLVWDYIAEECSGSGESNFVAEQAKAEAKISRFQLIWTVENSWKVSRDF